MNRYLLPGGVFLLLVIVLYIGIQRAPQKTVIPSALLGKPAPQFTLPVLGRNESFSSTSLAGRWHAINVWGTWCPECRVEHDMLLRIADSGELPLIGFNWKDDDAAALDWLAQLGNPYSVVVADRDGRAAIDWGVYGARLMSVSPGVVWTPMGQEEAANGHRAQAMADATPMGRWGTADDVAATVEFLASGAASYITGCDIRVDGGAVAAMRGTNF